MNKNPSRKKTADVAAKKKQPIELSKTIKRFHLNQIKDNLGARRKPKILGRGIGSGLGKTSGKGGKGQTARSGGGVNGFEGGQNPIYRRLPKRGFVNIFRIPLYELTFKHLEQLLKNKTIQTNEEITIDLLQAKGIIKRWYRGVSLIATGNLTHAVTIKVKRASKKAKEIVEKLGGKVV